MKVLASLFTSLFLFLAAIPLPGKDWVYLDRGERFVYSSTLAPPACGRYRISGYQVFKDDDNRFVFGRENLPGGQYIVAWRICGGVKVLQEAVKVPRRFRNKAFYGRITIRWDKNLRFYYAFEPHDPQDAAGWTSFSGVMDVANVKHEGTDGRKGTWLDTIDGKGPEGKAFKNRISPFPVKEIASIPIPEGKGFSCQGLAIQGDTAIIIRDKGWCEIYDVRRRKSLSFYKLEGNDSHCNNAVFGLERLSPDSPFPLLYISEDNGSHACLVTDIGMDGSQIVQKIYYDTDRSDYPGPFDWMVDRENGFLYTYGGSRWRSRWVKRFRLPPADIPEVHLGREDVLWTMYYDEVGIGQGGFVKDGRIYLTAGYPPYYCKLHVYDIATRRHILCQDLRELQFEPEGMDILDGCLYTVFWCRDEGTKIFGFDLRNLNNKRK